MVEPVIPTLPNNLAGIVYLDANQNSSLDSGETGIPTQVVSLYLGTTFIATGLTSSTGTYLFIGLPDGTYTVTYTNSSTYIPFASNTDMINWLPAGATSGVMMLKDIIFL